MLRKIAALATVAAATAACHSGGTYLQDAERMPYGPGVVDCSSFQRTENAYVHNGCWTPVPITGTILTVPVDPRAPRVDQPDNCTALQSGAVAVAGAAPMSRVAAVRAPASVAVRASAPVAVPATPTARVDVQDADWRPARSAASAAVSVDVPPAPSVRITAPSVAVPPAPSIRPGVDLAGGASLPSWDDPVPPPRPGVSLPRPRVEVQAR